MIRAALLTTGLALGLGVALMQTAPGQAQGSGRTWTVYNGGESPDAVVQVNTYRPSLMTVGVGDSVTWLTDSQEEHTVTFLSGGPRLPSSLRLGNVQFRNPLAIMPAGGSTYTGNGYVNSGFLHKGDTFTLTFAAPGTYEYVCRFHFGMDGQVVVD